MDNSMVRHRYSTSRPMRNRRRRRIPQRSGGLRKLIFFQSLICILIFLMVIIAKSIHISATDYITAQIKYVLEHNMEPKSISAYAGKLVDDIRNSIIPDSGKRQEADELVASKSEAPLLKAQLSDSLPNSDTTPTLGSPAASNYPVAQATQEVPVMEGNLSMSQRETCETGDRDVDVANEPETSVLSASSDWENGNSQSTTQMLNPVVGTLATDFGEISVAPGGNVKIHSGIDIYVEQRSSVKAALKGVVTKAGSCAQYGNYIVIQHDNDLETVYAHCSDILAPTGEIVGRGDVIAQVGDDIISVGRHLHFEVWLDGNNVDPLEYISVDDR